MNCIKNLSWNRAALLALVALATSACGGGGSSTPSGNSFVTSAIGQTSETAEPTQINDLDLSFSNSETAFDSLFQ